jgi:hypothetical protein
LSGLELIAAALAAGASAGLSNTATAAVQDAFNGLKQLLGRRLRGREQALEAAETEPGVWAALLGEELTASGATADDEVIEAAERLLSLVRQQNTYQVDLRDAKGVQVGDHNVQHNRFS